MARLKSSLHLGQGLETNGASMVKGYVLRVALAGNETELGAPQSDSLGTEAFEACSSWSGPM